VLPRGQGYPFNYPFREAKVHLCICLAGAILSIIPFAKRTYTCVFVLRALSGPACVRFLKAVFKVILSKIFDKMQQVLCLEQSAKFQFRFLLLHETSP
jgi:hypothetical protein